MVQVNQVMGSIHGLAFLLAHDGRPRAKAFFLSSDLAFPQRLCWQMKTMRRMLLAFFQNQEEEKFVGLTPFSWCGASS